MYPFNLYWVVHSFICSRKINNYCLTFVELLNPWNYVWILRVPLSHNIFFSCTKLWSIFQVLKIQHKTGEMHWLYFKWKPFLLIDWSLILLINGYIKINLKIIKCSVISLKTFKFFFHYIYTLILNIKHVSSINLYHVLLIFNLWRAD